MPEPDVATMLAHDYVAQPFEGSDGVAA